MRELIQKHDSRATIRWKLLTGVSALALTAYVSSTGAVRAEGNDQPQVWIELGGQLTRLQDNQEIYAPPFLALEPPAFGSPLKAQRPPLYGLDIDGSISFRPEDSNWIFSASVRYGRAGSNNHLHQQSYPLPYTKYLFGTHHVNKPIAAQFIDANSKSSETHAILDFEAGKDLGLGMFGQGSSSSLNLGVRIAQFRSKSNVTMHENPDWHFAYKYITYPTYGISHSRFPQGQPYHSYAGKLRANRSFHGIGPSISWKSSAALAGDAQSGAIMLDWGLNAAVLFGRQKTQTHHQTTAWSHAGGLFSQPGVRTTLYQLPVPPDHARSRNVTVPNVGGFAGLSFRYADAKLSLGYRADFFFNAIDGGIDARKSENRGFFGPFASISIGVGD